MRQTSLGCSTTHTSHTYEYFLIRIPWSRACGKVLCGTCCNERARLLCMENKLVRVCKPCKEELDRYKACL